MAYYMYVTFVFVIVFDVLFGVCTRACFQRICACRNRSTGAQPPMMYSLSNVLFFNKNRSKKRVVQVVSLLL